MSAKDDFELVRAACHIAEPFMKVDPIEAFSRLFTPRPLRELVAEGYKYAWVLFSEGWCHWHEGMKPSPMDAKAIPILTPDDMGVK